MKDESMKLLSQMVFSPWIQKATHLKSINRKILGGVGNAFRHQMNVFAILIDHEIYDSIVLKASLIHDLIEEFRDTNIQELRYLDSEGNQVVDVVLELTVRIDYHTNEPEAKKVYLERILTSGSHRAKLIKAADRIDNLMQINFKKFKKPNSEELDVERNKQYIKQYLDETEEYVVKGVEGLNINLKKELDDLIEKLRLEHGLISIT